MPLTAERSLIGAETFRDAALQLQGAMERQRRALDLQTDAIRELNAAVAEQAQVISGLLVGDVHAELRTEQSDDRANQQVSPPERG